MDTYHLIRLIFGIIFIIVATTLAFYYKTTKGWIMLIPIGFLLMGICNILIGLNKFWLCRNHMYDEITHYY